MKKFIIIALIYILVNQGGFCAEFDDSIDSELRKQYKVDELPALPKVSPSKAPQKPSVQKTSVTIQNDKLIQNNYSGKVYTIKSGSKIILISKNPISNWSSEGTKISFVSQNQIVTKEGEIIPSGTIFKGSVINSHPPQITGNGGLIQLKINEIYFKGMVSFIDTKLTEANSKKVILGKIKGKRKYWKNCKKALTPGEKTFKVMKKASRSIAPIPVINILGIIPYTIGSVVYILNASTVPVISIFMKGGSISIPEGTSFHVTVLGNNQIRG